MYINSQNQIYFGDYVAGDRAATPEEVAAWEASRAADAAKSEALAYLASTDWMIVRFAETQVAVHDDVLKKRAAARLAV
jgi:hypothetical protein